jgi:hypothetical protein
MYDKINERMRFSNKSKYKSIIENSRACHYCICECILILGLNQMIRMNLLDKKHLTNRIQNTPFENFFLSHNALTNTNTFTWLIVKQDNTSQTLIYFWVKGYVLYPVKNIDETWSNKNERMPKQKFNRIFFLGACI